MWMPRIVDASGPPEPAALEPVGSVALEDKNEPVEVQPGSTLAAAALLDRETVRPGSTLAAAALLDRETLKERFSAPAGRTEPVDTLLDVLSEALLRYIARRDERILRARQSETQTDR